MSADMDSAPVGLRVAALGVQSAAHWFRPGSSEHIGSWPRGVPCEPAFAGAVGLVPHPVPVWALQMGQGTGLVARIMGAWVWGTRHIFVSGLCRSDHGCKPEDAARCPPASRLVGAPAAAERSREGVRSERGAVG